MTGSTAARRLMSRLICGVMRRFIDLQHALVRLARAIDWRFLEEKFGAVYPLGNVRHGIDFLCGT